MLACGSASVDILLSPGSSQVHGACPSWISPPELYGHSYMPCCCSNVLSLRLSRCKNVSTVQLWCPIIEQFCKVACGLCTSLLLSGSSHRSDWTPLMAFSSGPAAPTLSWRGTWALTHPASQHLRFGTANKQKEGKGNAVMNHANFCSSGQTEPEALVWLKLIFS